MVWHNLILWPALWVFMSQVQAACECGYTINSTTEENYALFTDILETDFRNLSTNAFDWDQRNHTGWMRQVYNQSAEASRNGGHYGINVSASNAILNPLKKDGAYAGQSQLGGDAGLQLWVRGQVIDNLISTGQVVTTRNDIVYGSFRIGVKMTSIPGTCGAFFWYHNDSQEVDFEYLSYQQAPNAADNRTYHPINLVIQTPQSAAAGFNAAGTPNFKLVPMPFDPAKDFHEFRFDWTPYEVTYYADSTILATMTYEIPTAPGGLFINHWSNGNPGWSQGPPTQDALMTVSYVKAYFNTSNDFDQSRFDNACLKKYSASEQTNHTCKIPDQQNYFFTSHGGYHPSHTGAPSPTHASSTNPPGSTNSSPSKGAATLLAPYMTALVPAALLWLGLSMSIPLLA